MRIAGIFLTLLTVLNIAMNYYYKVYIHTNPKDVPEVQVALVLGAGIRNNKPSPILKRRLQGAIDLYKNKRVHTILVSGDNTKKFYHEVNVMKEFLLQNGIPIKNILLDFNGTNTFNSMYNCKNFFKIDSVVIVTQMFHLSRAIFLAKRFELNVVGYASDSKNQESNAYILVREFFARYLALFDALFIFLNKDS